MSKTITEQRADVGIVILIKHIMQNGAKSMTYTDFCDKINASIITEKPLSPWRSGGVLGKIGHILKDFDETAPLITILILGKNTRGEYADIPASGFKEFRHDWDKLNDDGKKDALETEKKEIDKYLQRGMFDKFLSELENGKDINIEDSYFHEDENYTVTVRAAPKNHHEYEGNIRDDAIVKKKKEDSKYICECCNFNFCKKYGKLGERYIECHHIKPFAKIKKGDKIELNDLAALCANCHRMIHKLLARNIAKYEENYHLSIGDLREVIKTHTQKEAK